MLRVQRARQRLTSSPLPDVAGAVQEQLAQSFVRSDIAGKRIGVTAGSRGIASIDLVIKTAIAWLRAAGAEPVIIPAMGSHGGATSAGQAKVLAHYGITEATCGAPILSDMSVIELGTAEGVTVYWSKAAWSCDGILLVNRVKAHTGFIGRDLESGLAKICAVGLGKERGATEIHSNEPRLGMERSIRAVYDHVMSTGKIVGGLALVEDGCHQLAIVRGMDRSGLIDGERALLRQAVAFMPQLPFPFIDVLHVRRMGKDISGAGMDPNIIGRRPEGYRIRDLPRPGMPTIARLLVSDLTPASGGNAIGIGFADGTTERLIAKMDRAVTLVNCTASHELRLADVPRAFKNDRELIERTVAELGSAPGDVRACFIDSTLALQSMFVTPALAEHTDGRCTIDDGAFDLPFDDSAMLALDFAS